MIIFLLNNAGATNAVSQIGSAAVALTALFGGVRFLYKYFSEGALIGFSPRHSFKERSPETLARIGQMPIISESHLKLVLRAFIAATHMAKTNIIHGNSSTMALKQRMGSVIHILAASAVINQRCVEIMESAAYPLKRWAPFALWRSRWLPLVE
jgi:hypothetical protein